MIDEPCDYCGNEPEECVCHLAPDFPDEVIPELDTNMLDWEHYEEYGDESDGQAAAGKTDLDG